jgi:hypothetical protein
MNQPIKGGIPQIAHRKEFNKIKSGIKAKQRP